MPSLFLLWLSWFGSLTDFNRSRAELARLRITKPQPYDKVALFSWTIEDFVIGAARVNNETMSDQLMYYSQHRRWQSFGMSLLAHGLLAGFLILLWQFSSPQYRSDAPELRRASIVMAINHEQKRSEYLTENNYLEQLATSSPQSSNPADQPLDPPPVAAATNDPPKTTGFLPPESMLFDATRMANVPTGSQVKLEFELSAADIKLIESDRRLLKSREPVGNPATIGVFGSGNLQGREFVFVLDRSQSMGNSGLGVIQASQIELSQAINQLEPHHKFQIVAYHNRTTTLLTRNLLPANDRNKKAVTEFIGNLSAFGGTHHENGLIAALVFHPDVIVLLTDGGYPELNDGKLEMIRRLAGNRTQIHCIQFGAGPLPNKRNFMTRLAAQNAGSFRYIDVNQWTKSP